MNRRSITHPQSSVISTLFSNTMCYIISQDIPLIQVAVERSGSNFVKLPIAIW